MAKFPYTNIGHCIYCGSTDEPLTREHVLPRGIGGNNSPGSFGQAMVLQKATCDDCKDIIHKFETAYMEKSLGLGRARLGMNRKDRRPTTTRVKTIMKDSSVSILDVNFDAIDCPLLIPHFREAKILLEKFGIKSEETYDLWVGNTFTGNRLGFHPETDKYEYAMDLHIEDFSRFLAKIAHGTLTTFLGPDGFRPLLCDAIRSKGTDFNWFVGGDAPKEEKRDSKSPLHYIEYKQDYGFWIVIIQLFARFGGPVNYVVAGEPL